MKPFSLLALGLALLGAPASSYAVSVPLPVDATLNLNVQMQPQFIVNEAGTPDGLNPSYDLFLRRARITFTGNVGKSVSYLFRLDSPNLGKFGNLTGRVALHDAWVGWAPTGIDGGTVVQIEAGLLLIPISRHVLGYTTNYITVDRQTDAFRLPNDPFPAFRDVGVQVRGWALDKKIGFRGIVHGGYTPFDQPAGECTTGEAEPGRGSPRQLRCDRQRGRSVAVQCVPMGYVPHPQRERSRELSVAGAQEWVRQPD
jgi:hypothetical protein